ncbi:Ser recombinase [Shewanella sp. phage 1/4]|uniref:DNA invertase n=1 Tax=Shewanella phage 1/4 TaxID=1458859 RepID=UPI0004F5A1DA|nr:DNA invertase [Shewanella sp. phage 1/4]AHK11129.1 Ser recombinase [Shewanella sp. phage 1/4]
MKVVLYRRLSKEDKTKNQHGLDSQLADINYYLNTLDSYEIIGDFSEFISGGADKKLELNKAIALCEKEGATLVVAKLDRLSRRVSQIALYMEGSVKFKVALMPSAENLQLHIYAALAEEERASIRDRTKRGCAAAKAKGILSGRASPNYGMNSGNGTKNIDKIIAERKQAALEKSMYVVPEIKKALKYLGKRPTQQKVATFLNDANIPTPSGRGSWKQSTVQRVLERHNINLF